jgi:hypothetical protein
LTVHNIIVLTGCQWVSIELCTPGDELKYSTHGQPAPICAVGVDGPPSVMIDPAKLAMTISPLRSSYL